MNIIEIQDSLKDLPDNALMQEMQMPTGSAPQFLVLSELKRRKRMRDEYQRRQNVDMKTVAEEAISAAGMPQGGIMDAARAMAPQTNVAQNTGMNTAIPTVPTQAPQPEQPMMMADGGVVRMFEGGMSGGTISAIANLKVNYPDVYEAAVEEGVVEEMAEYMQARAADAPYALDALEDPAPFFMKRPSRRSVDKKQLEIEESQPERALQARIDSRTALSRYSDDDPIFGPSALEQRESPVTGEYTAALDIPVTSVEGKLPLPPSDPLGSIPDITELGVKTPSGSALSGLIPPVADDGFGTESIQNMLEQERQDDIYKFLADPNSAAIADRLDEANLEGDEKYRKRILEGNLAAHKGLFFPKGSSGQEVARKDVNLRALQFLQGDQSTPPSEIYSDLLGGDPRAIAKYQEESPQVIDQISDRLALEAQQGELAKQEQLFGDYDAEAQAQRDAEIAGQRDVLEQIALARAGERLKDQQPTKNLTGIAGTIQKGLDYVGDPTLNFLEGATNKFGELVESGQQKVGDYFDAKRAMESDEADLGAGNQIIDPSQTAKAREDAATAKAVQDIADIQGSITSGGVSGAGFGSLDSRIAKMLADRQKQAESDKWMALAYAGMELMKPTSTIGEGLGKAGQAGLGYLTQAKKGMQDFETDMLKLQTQLARAAGGSKSGALTLNQYLSRGEDLITAGQKMLENAGDNADAAARGQDLIDRGMALISIATGGGSASSGGAKTVNIS